MRKWKPFEKPSKCDAKKNQTNPKATETKTKKCLEEGFRNSRIEPGSETGIPLFSAGRLREFFLPLLLIGPGRNRRDVTHCSNPSLRGLSWNFLKKIYNIWVCRILLIKFFFRGIQIWVKVRNVLKIYMFAYLN